MAVETFASPTKEEALLGFEKIQKKKEKFRTYKKGGGGLHFSYGKKKTRRCL